MRKILLLSVSILLGSQMIGQEINNLRNKTFYLPADSIIIDTLSLVPGSLILTLPGGKAIEDSLYGVNYSKSILYISGKLRLLQGPMNVRYRVFPISLSKAVYHKKPDFNKIDPAADKPRFIYSPSSLADPFANSEIVSNGNISRGLMVGNTRDPSLSSNLNLQLNGRISKDFLIEANLSDASIPIQPEGNTQQIQDFDRLYLRVYNSRSEVLGGDFELQSPTGYFLRMNKKVQGARVKSQIFNNEAKKTRVTSSISGAVVKGKYTHNSIKGQEGNQGPYRLSGQNGESYIQVIAGSEKVFIDGELLIRGEQNDYVIDYNTAELRFTPRKLITKDKRIRVEFEYTEQSYARFLLASNTDWEREKGNWYVHVFSEHDAKNQPLLQDLSDARKSLLGRIGDQSSQAVVPNYFPVDFQNDRVLYKLQDTLVNGVRYDSILVYSIHPDSAMYQAGFSFVGTNNGNYTQVTSSANGQVYRWIAPVDGVPQGNYAPLTRLVSPKSKQVFVAGGKEQLSSRMDLSVEMAITRNDLNSFSNIDDSDNVGYGLSSKIRRKDPIKSDSSWLLTTEIEYRRTGKQFDPLERFRSVEFERDWNLNENISQGSENYLGSNIMVEGKDSIMAGYKFEYLSFSGPYRAFRHLSQGDVSKSGWSVMWDGSYMNSNNTFRSTRFARHNLQLSKEFKRMRIFAGENHEGNLWTEDDSPDLEGGSFSFQEWKFGVENATQAKMPWYIHFTNRSDYLPGGMDLLLDTEAWQVESGLNIQGKKGRRTSLSVNWRDLRSNSADNLEESDGQSLSGRIEENFQLGRGALVSRTFYEIGSGLERKMEYTYIQVAPGQGYYTWTDYNQNGNKELDEFEPAHFRDQADFIRIFRPGTTYIPTYQNRFNQVLNFRPDRFFKQDSKASKVLSRFSNSLAYRVDKKNYRTRLMDQINPFSSLEEDSLLVSSSNQFRNTLSFNKNSSLFGIDYHFEKNQSQTLLSYGTDIRSNKANRIVIRSQPFDIFWITNLTEKGLKEYNSSFFSGKNYRIDYLRNDIELTFKPADSWQTGFSHEWRKEGNIGLPEKIRVHRLESSLSYQMPTKGQIQMDLNYLAIQFTGDPNSPVGYVLLQGFQPGHNGMLRMSLRRKLNQVIQLDFRYEGRVSQGNKVIHTGSVQIRAVF